MVKKMEEKTHTTIGKVSFILGIISLLLIILIPIIAAAGKLTPDAMIVLSYFEYLIVLPGATIAIILGFMARKQGDKYGVIGLVLGLVIIILFIISIVISGIIYFDVSGVPPKPPT